MIATGFIMMGVNSSFGVFFNSLVDDYSLTRASTSAILSVRMIFSAIAALLAGWAIDRYGPRKVISVMGCFVGLSLVLTSLTEVSWQIFITYSVLMSIGTGAVYVVITSTVLRWFDRKRGLALGITGIGGGIGTAIISPLSALLITTLGWRNTMRVLGGFSWLFILPTAQLLKKDPLEIGVLPDGDIPVGESPTNKISEITQPQIHLHQVFSNISFWAVFFIWLFMAFSSFFIMTHIVPHAIDIGFSQVESAAILSFSGIAMIVGRLVAGIITDKVNPKGIAVVSSFIQLAAIISLVWGRELWMLYFFGLIHGLTFGSFDTPIIVLISRSFALNDIGKILGILEVGIFIGGAIGPYLGGLLFDIFGSYTLAFVIMSVAVLFRIFLVFLIRPKSVS
ncbi:MFS transporter [Chloroflexota bacterium]